MGLGGWDSIGFINNSINLFYYTCNIRAAISSSICFHGVCSFPACRSNVPVYEYLDA